MIVVEDLFRLIVSDLPLMSYREGAPEYSVKFGFGDDKELMYFLSQKQTKLNYPLIWMVYPYQEDHYGTKVSVDNVSFILATESNDVFLNQQRFDTNYERVLEPLFDNFTSLLKTCNVMNLDENIKVVKYPNYSNEERPGNRETLVNSEQNKTNTIWDALKITISFVADGKKCYRTRESNKLIRIDKNNIRVGYTLSIREYLGDKIQ